MSNPPDCIGSCLTLVPTLLALLFAPVLQVVYDTIKDRKKKVDIQSSQKDFSLEAFFEF